MSHGQYNSYDPRIIFTSVSSISQFCEGVLIEWSHKCVYDYINAAMRTFPSRELILVMIQYCIYSRDITFANPLRNFFMYMYNSLFLRT